MLTKLLSNPETWLPLGTSQIAPTNDWPFVTSNRIGAKFWTKWSHPWLEHYCQSCPVRKAPSKRAVSSSCSPKDFLLRKGSVLKKDGWNGWVKKKKKEMCRKYKDRLPLCGWWPRSMSVKISLGKFSWKGEESRRWNVKNGKYNIQPKPFDKSQGSLARCGIKRVTRDLFKSKKI